jgi:hypothetical protein
MFTQSLIAASAATETAGGMSTEVQALLVGGGIFVIFMVLLLITMSYSNVGNRHQVKAEPEDTHRSHANKHGHH